MKTNAKQLRYGRGVWIAPWLGPSGETILVALDREERQVGDVALVATNEDINEASDRLWQRLEAAPDTRLLRLVP